MLLVSLLALQAQAASVAIWNNPEFPDQVLSVMAHRLSIDRGWVEAEAKPNRFTIERKPVTVNLD